MRDGRDGACRESMHLHVAQCREQLRHLHVSTLLRAARVLTPTPLSSAEERGRVTPCEQYLHEESRLGDEQLTLRHDDRLTSHSHIAYRFTVHLDGNCENTWPLHLHALLQTD